jgi:RimJ/RimL family protein N-acetyltransferase
MALAVSDVQVRPLGPPDAAAFRALRLRGFREHPEAFTTSYEEELLKPVSVSEVRLGQTGREKFWGAFTHHGKGDLVGMVGLDRDPRRHCQHKGMVIAMYVATEWTGHGLGRALLGAVLQDAKAAGLERLVLTVTRGNQAAEHLYQRTGFVSFGIEPGAIKVNQQLYDKNYMGLVL